MMKRLSIVVCLGVCLVHGTSAAGESEPGPLTVGWKMAVASKYLFQGIDYSDGHPVAQPELSLEYRGFSLTSWSSFDLDEQQIKELDLLFVYGLELGDLSVTPGYARYRYPNRGWEPSQEAYLDLSYATLLDLSLSSHYDFDAGKGAYFTLGLHRDVETSVGTFSAGSNLFYQRNYYEVSGIPSLEFTANYSRSIRSVSITPSVSYFTTWDNGDFKGQSAVPKQWVVSLTVGQSY
ncbi:MAG: hypothetical protein HY207_05195 [Nitrospirae bacterium]|nr:hypothetical protein [Nitrospirota bacterium]